MAGSGKEIPSVRQSTKNFSTIYAKVYSKKVKYDLKKKSGTSSKNLYLNRPWH